MDKSSRYERRARVARIERLTPTGTIRLTFEVADAQPFSFLPGNFVGVDCDLPAHGYRRSPYCICSPPSDGRTFQNLVRTVPEGPVSNFLASLEVGDIISFRGPTGRSMLPRERDTELLLLATGVGLGPFLSLTRHLLSGGFERPVKLFWGLRLPEDVCLTDELDALAREHANFSHAISLSQAPSEWRGLRGRLTETLPPLLESLGGKQFYLCGNGAMIAEMRRALSDLGVPKRLIYEEYFFNFKHAPGEREVERIVRRFRARDLASPLALMNDMLERMRH